jgi:hypothetical protein
MIVSCISVSVVGRPGLRQAGVTGHIHVAYDYSCVLSGCSVVNGAAALAGKRASLSGHLVYADHDSMIGIAIWQPCHDEASERG